MANDLDNAIAAGKMLYQASSGRIPETTLAIMLAICGRESGWNPSAVQAGGEIGSPLIGVGLWQITPGTEEDLSPLTNAEATWAKMTAQANPFAPWNLEPDGKTLIFSVAQTPSGPVPTVPPSAYEYTIGSAAARAIFSQVQSTPKGTMTMPVFIETVNGTYVQGANGLLHLLSAEAVTVMKKNGAVPFSDPTASVANAIGIADTKPL